MTLTSDPSTQEMRAALSSPAPTDRRSLSRRGFLQASALLSGAAMMPLWLADEAEAVQPLGAKDGILVLITMDGGCDGLSLVAPIIDGYYYDVRGGLAVPAASSLQLDGAHGLNPRLPLVKQMWDTGQVAVIEGVGDPQGDLSHFNMMARLQTAKANNGAQTSGWLGRYLDGLPGGGDPFHGIAFGHTVPLVGQGQRYQTTAIPSDGNGLLVRSELNSAEQRQLDAWASFGAGSSGLGSLGDSLGQSGLDAIDLAVNLKPRYDDGLPEEDGLARELALAARLINANLGVRVFTLNFGDFDGHANHNSLHNNGFDELNAGLQVFFDTLSAEWADQTLVLTSTEFGRRFKANNSGGTDHGAAATYLAIGSQVNGGFYGQAPSLTNLDANRNLAPTVDYRAVYGSVLDQWLDADAGEVLGANYENLGFVAKPATKASPTPPSIATGLAARDQVFRLYQAYFRRSPDAAGLEYWVGQRAQGVSIDAVSQAFAGSAEFAEIYGSVDNQGFVDLVYQNVLGRLGDPQGRAFWVGQLNEGMERGRVMIGFSDSPEFRSQIGPVIVEWDRTGPIARLYQAYFRRLPDTAGLNYWTGTGLPLAEISQAFSESSEFKTVYGPLSNREFVELVYTNVMGRVADQRGVNFWTGELDKGANRGSIMVGFSESSEFVARFKQIAG